MTQIGDNVLMNITQFRKHARYLGLAARRGDSSFFIWPITKKKGNTSCILMVSAETRFGQPHTSNEVRTVSFDWRTGNVWFRKVINPDKFLTLTRENFNVMKESMIDANNSAISLTEELSSLRSDARSTVLLYLTNS